MKLMMILIACAALSACASRTLASNSRSVTVMAGAAMTGEAQKKADEECGKYSRVAVLAGKIGPTQWVYDCVAP